MASFWEGLLQAMKGEWSTLVFSKMTDDFTSLCPTCCPYGLVEGNTKKPEALWFHGIHGKSMVNPVKMFHSNRQWGVFGDRWVLSGLTECREQHPHWAAHRHGSVDPWRPSRRFRLWDGKNGSIHQNWCFLMIYPEKCRFPWRFADSTWN